MLQTDYLYSKICLTIQIGLQWGNDNRKIKHYLKKLELLRKKPAVSLAKFIIYKFVYDIVHFVIIVSYLALIRPLFVELGFRQIKRKYILYYYTTIPI